MKKILIITCMALGLSYSALAQNGPGFDDDVDDVPLDGGISLLAAASAVYGAKKYYQKKDIK